MNNLNPAQKVNPKLFDLAVEQVTSRQGFGEGLLLAAEANPQVVGLSADLTESTKMSAFAEKFPERFIQVGVAEQNLASVASGLAAMGKVPFIASYATFSPGRNWEQIRTTICFNDRPVKIVGTHAGVNVGADGGTHQALEDIAITRVIPNLDVIVPCDAIEARKATMEAAKSPRPTYIRLSREKSPLVTTDASPFEIGEANLLRNPEVGEVAIIACGPMVYHALQAAKKLEQEGIEAFVLNLHTIKPLDEESITVLAKSAGAIVTAEEHQVRGGMGSAVAEVLARRQPVPIEFVGVEDRFGQSGEPNELAEEYGLDAKAIIAATKKVLDRKEKFQKTKKVLISK
jgi:transketolase